MILDVYLRSAYGVERIYPANDAARAVAELAGRATLSEKDLRIAARLGHTVNVVSDPKAKTLAFSTKGD